MNKLNEIQLNSYTVYVLHVRQSHFHTILPARPCSEINTGLVTWKLLPRQQIEIKQCYDFTTGKRENKNQKQKNVEKFLLNTQTLQ